MSIPSEQVIGWAIVVGPVVLLVLIYFLRPQLKSVQISSAGFFKDLVAKNQPRWRARWANFRSSTIFFYQLAILLLILFGLRGAYLDQSRLENEKRVGVWMVLDTSASMSTQDSSNDRMSRAYAEIDALTQYLTTLRQDKVDVCLNILAFDQELRLMSVAAALETPDPSDLMWRNLGTDLALIRQLLARLDETDMDMACPMTHLVVISDMAVPGWVIESQNASIVWRDVGQTVANVGIVDAYQTGGLLGSPVEITVELEAYEISTSTSTAIRVTDPTGSVVSEEELDWELGLTDTITFAPERDGDYVVQLAPADAYLLDNQITLRTRVADTVHIDWQIPGVVPDTQTLNPNWVNETIPPDVRIARWPSTPDSPVPTLLVGSGYSANASASQIAYFDETSELLDDLDFDVAESLGMIGPTLEEIDPLFPILVSEQGSVWIAVGYNPLRAYIPGLPQEAGDDIEGAFAMTLYYNALRWLLQLREPPPLYTLTSIDQLTVEENRVPLHPNEGNTAGEHLSWRDYQTIQPVLTNTDEDPWWPLLLTCACVLFLIERSAYMWGKR